LIELLTKIIGYGILKEKLKKIWILNSGFDIKDVSKRFYTLKFDQQEEKDKVITGGLLDDFLPSLDKQKLDPMFISLMAQVEHTLVWIRFQRFNCVYFDESFLLAMTSAIEQSITVYVNTLKVKYQRYAEIDLLHSFLLKAFTSFGIINAFTKKIYTLSLLYLGQQVFFFFIS